MQSHTELAARELSEFEEKLQNLKGYIGTLKEAARTDGAESEHYDDDLMKAENDPGYYEAEIKRLREAAGIPSPPLVPVRTDASALVQTGLAFAAGIFVGLLIHRSRDAG